MTKKEEAPTAVADDIRAFETEVDELLGIFYTDQIAQEKVERECELV